MKGLGWMIWLMRIGIGSIFTYSGFTKGVDPFGTLYKVREYLTSLGLWFPDSIILTGVILLCSFEFLLGIFLLTGCYRKSSPLMALGFMIFMLLLSGWIAIADPVSDCGCFGDALVLSNTATFLKNIIITWGVIWLVKFNTEAPCLITPYIQWLALVGGLAYISIISLFGYEIQPLQDYRPFPIGQSIIPEETDDETEDLRFVYKRGNEIMEVSASDPLPSEEDGWVFSERIENNKISLISNQEKKSYFSIYTIGDEESEVTEEMIEGDEILLIFAPELERVSKSNAWKIEALAEEAQREGIKSAFIVSASDGVISVWRDLLDSSVEIYKGEDTVMKMIARGNPAVALVNDGVIVWKSTMRSLPVENLGKNWIKQYSRNDRNILLILTVSLIGWLVFLIFISNLKPILSHKKTGTNIGSD